MTIASLLLLSTRGPGESSKFTAFSQSISVCFSGSGLPCMEEQWVTMLSSVNNTIMQYISAFWTEKLCCLLLLTVNFSSAKSFGVKVNWRVSLSLTLCFGSSYILAKNILPWNRGIVGLGYALKKHFKNCTGKCKVLARMYSTAKRDGCGSQVYQLS